MSDIKNPIAPSLENLGSVVKSFNKATIKPFKKGVGHLGMTRRSLNRTFDTNGPRPLVRLAHFENANIRQIERNLNRFSHNAPPMLADILIITQE